MRNIADTIARFRPSLSAVVTPDDASRLEPLQAFGTNPGALKGWCYLPPARPIRGLIVALHGCTQSAAAYDFGSGWSNLAAHHGFAVLVPEQQAANNANRRFNWFVPDDIKRDGGEAASIRQMVAALIDRYPIDPGRVFVTGLSAGGTMAMAMLAAYPEVFAAGAIVAGLPYACANSVPQALERMRGQGHPPASRAANLIRSASPHHGRWPALSVWHGTADRTVADMNADAILDQWRDVHDAASQPARTDIVDGHRHRVWLDPAGNVVLEDYRIDGMGHGIPLRTQGPRSAGRAGAYMLDVGISATWHSADRWGLIDHDLATDGEDAQPTATVPSNVAAHSAFDVQGTIEAALRQAGLMR